MVIPTMSRTSRHVLPISAPTLELPSVAAREAFRLRLSATAGSRVVQVAVVAALRSGHGAVSALLRRPGAGGHHSLHPPMHTALPVLVVPPVPQRSWGPSISGPSVRPSAARQSPTWSPVGPRLFVSRITGITGITRGVETTASALRIVAPSVF